MLKNVRISKSRSPTPLVTLKDDHQRDINSWPQLLVGASQTGRDRPEPLPLIAKENPHSPGENHSPAVTLFKVLLC